MSPCLLVTLFTESLITYVTDRAGHGRGFSVDTAKAQAGLGYEPLHSFPQGIRRTVA